MSMIRDKMKNSSLCIIELEELEDYQKMMEIGSCVWNGRNIRIEKYDDELE